MKIAIVDDNVEMLEIIRTCIMENNEYIVEECNIFQKSQWLLDGISEGYQYDVYFLDIEMPEINGLELAKKIRQIQSSAYIVFITSHADYALTSYDIKIKAYQYVMKDNILKRLPEVLLAISSELKENKNDYYIIQNKLHYEKIKVLDIMYIYKESKNSIFVTRDGICRERKALNKVMKSLGKPEFLFIDPGRIVNIKYIRRIEGDTIVLMDGTGLYASRANMRKVKDGISNYWGNKS